MRGQPFAYYLDIGEALARLRDKRFKPCSLPLCPTSWQVACVLKNQYRPLLYIAARPALHC